MQDDLCCPIDIGLGLPAGLGNLLPVDGSNPAYPGDLPLSGLGALSLPGPGDLPFLHGDDRFLALGPEYFPLGTVPCDFLCEKRGGDFPLAPSPGDFTLPGDLCDLIP